MVAGEEQGQGRQENGACVLSRETAQHPFEFQDFKGESVLKGNTLTGVAHISWQRGIFASFCVLGIWQCLQTSVGLFFTAGDGEGTQQGCWGMLWCF